MIVRRLVHRVRVVAARRLLPRGYQVINNNLHLSYFHEPEDDFDPDGEDPSKSFRNVYRFMTEHPDSPLNRPS